MVVSMRIRVLPLPGDRFILVADRVESLAGHVSEWCRDLKAAVGAHAVVVSREDVELDACATAFEGPLPVIELERAKAGVPSSPAFVDGA